jgi:hypothetical protein
MKMGLSPFRLRLNVREHNNQADTRFELIPIERDAVMVCYGRKNCSTRDASSSTVVAWNQERSIFVLLLAPCTCRIF